MISMLAFFGADAAVLFLLGAVALALGTFLRLGRRPQPSSSLIVARILQLIGLVLLTSLAIIFFA